jgi:hypothetical protein
VYTSLSERPRDPPKSTWYPALNSLQRVFISSYSILVDSVWILHTSTHSFMLYSNIKMGPFGWYHAVTARPYKYQSMLGSLGKAVHRRKTVMPICAHLLLSHTSLFPPSPYPPGSTRFYFSKSKPNQCPIARFATIPMRPTIIPPYPVILTRYG